MPARASDRESCHKRGVVLTCYVNGRKRFRAVPLSFGANMARLETTPASHRNNGSTSKRLNKGSTSKHVPLGAGANRLT